MNAKLLAVVAVAVSSQVFGQVQVQVQLPSIHFATPPPLVVVSPGVQVVEDHDDEVFFADGWYWVQRDSRWFRTRDHRGSWAVVEPAIVPRPIVVLPRGKYKRWKREKTEKHHGGPQGMPPGQAKKHGHGKH